LEGGWNHLMTELIPEPDSTGGGKIYIYKDFLSYAICIREITHSFLKRLLNYIFQPNVGILDNSLVFGGILSL
jgi:hypothetical protein